MLDRQEKIQSRAYALWEKTGYPHGTDWDHWFKAEQEVDAELLKGFKPAKAPPRAKAPAKPKKKAKTA